MSSRKSKKRIGSTRQRHQGYKAEERGANEELQEVSTAQHLQLSNSSEMPTCQLDFVPENIEGSQHDPGKTNSENFETGALADISEAETSTSGKKRRMGSTRRAKQGLQAEERKEQEEVKSMQIVQEEFNVTETEDQYFKEYSDAGQAQTQMPELGGSEVKDLGTGDESPNERHKLLSELELKTETEACSTEIPSPPVSFIQSPTPVANPPVCVTGTHPEEGETSHKQDEQSCFNMFEVKEICSDDRPLQNTPRGLSDQQRDESAEDVGKSEEQRGAKEVHLEGSLNQEIIMEIEKVDGKPVSEMEVEWAGIQDFSLQMQHMTQKSAFSSTMENISTVKENSQIFHPSDANIDGTVMEGYNKFGNQNITESEQTSSINVSQEEDKNSEHNVQKLKKRMGSTRRPLKAIKLKEDIGNSQVGTQDNTLQEEMSVKEDTQFREMAVFNDKLEMVFTVNVRGGELEGTGDEFEEHTAMATDAFPSTENITDGIGTSTRSSHLIMEGEGAEILHPGVLGEQISEHLSYHALDEETLQIVDQRQFTENTNLTPEFTTQYVDQLQQHGEINSENSLETPEHQERQSSTSMEVSEQTEVENKLSFQCIPDDSSPDSAGITIEDIDVTEKTESFSSQIGFETVSEASGHSEQEHQLSSPTPHNIPENTVAQLNVHAESFSSEMCSPDVQHSEEAEQGTQVHILSSTMDSEVPNISTDVPDFYHSLNVESTDPSETSTLSDHSQSSLKLQHQEEEESVQQDASWQKRRMGSTRRPKREQKKEATCGAMSTDDVNEDMNMNADTEITVAPLNVHAESSSTEMLSPNVQHCEEAEQGTQAHILSSTMESEVPNISTDIPDFSHALNVESTDPSETSTLSSHSESSFKLQHQEEEGSVQGASRQKRRMGSTRRTKREQKREEPSGAMSADDVKEDMNADTIMRSEAEEGIIGESIIGVSKENEFVINQTDAGTLSMALTSVEQNQYVDSSLSVETVSSSFQLCNPEEGGQKQEYRHQYPDIIAEQLDGNDLEDNNEMSILGKETAEVRTTVGADLSNEAFMKEDVDQLKKHEEEKSESFLEAPGDQNKENINTKVSEQTEAENILSSPTEDPSLDCAGTTVEDMDTTEKATSFSCQIAIETLTCLGSPPSPSSDHIPEIDTSLNVHKESFSPEMHSPDVQHSEEVEQGTNAHIDGNYLEDNNEMSIMEKETEAITTVGADQFSEAFMREDVEQLKKHEEEQSEKSQESLADLKKENRISTELSEQAEVESKLSYITEDLSPDTIVEGMVTTESPSESHTCMESSIMEELRAESDHWESTVRLQPHEKEGNLNQDVSRNKRKMGSTRRQKRKSNEVHLDGTRSSHETEVMTGMVTETDIEVQQEENLQSEEISSSENMQAACLNTILVGCNECLMKYASKETVDEPNKQDLSSQESEKEKGEKDILMILEGKVENQREVDLGPPETHRAVQCDTTVEGQGRILEQIQDKVTETSVSASQYPQTEESPGLKRRRKLGSTRRSQHEKTERKYVVMDGMLIHTDTETSPCLDSKSVEVKDEEERKIHDIEENTEAMSSIFGNTIVTPSTPESLETDQERSNDAIHSKDEVIKKEQCILAPTITTAEQPPLENIAGNDYYSAHGDTLAVNSKTPPANSPSCKNTLKLCSLENSDSSEESKPQKKRMGSSRKISQRQHKNKNSSHSEADVKNGDLDSVTNTVTQPIQQVTGDVDLCAEHRGGLEGAHNYKWTDIHQSKCSEPASGACNHPEDHLIPEMYVQSPLGQIEISESSGTTAAETSSGNLCEDDSQKEPKSMLQKRKMGSSRRGQGLRNRAKQAANVDEHVDDISTSKQDGDDTALPNTEDLSMEGEQLLITSVQTSKSNLQPLAQAERPDEFIDERVLPASAQCRTSVHSASSSPSSKLQEDNPSIDPQSTTKKKKMGSTRKNMKRQGEDEKSGLKRDQGNAERCNVIDDMGDLTGPTERVTIQKVTETGESEDTLPQDEGTGHGSAGHKEAPEGTRRKVGSRRGGQGCRGAVGGPEDQPVSQAPENDSSVLQNIQENVHSEGLSKLVLAGEGQFQKVEQPPSGARSKSDLDRKYGQDNTLTSLEEAVMFNVVMVGDSSVGKTSFIRRFQSGQFIDDHSATIGIDTFTQTLAVDGELVKLQIWDTAGQERFHSITHNVLHKAQGLILMYDISSCQTFSAVRKWITCIEEGAPSEVIILLLGNKNDSEDREVLHPEGERLAQEYNIHFMECSAVTGYNVSQSIESLARLLKQTVKESGQGYVTLHQKPPQKKSGCC
ncbi:uncharacterized protein rab44 isoform X1 [Alosa sapidissima]|uniref:uncharacterized protein rab44 isoform X1 n=1 Tax=Alosa sapidissima TaxID=34773 RepID=UPI001C0917FD|nr:uncharacterized protein rab44 isoform X1 [Alosa sapidissima]